MKPSRLAAAGVALCLIEAGCRRPSPPPEPVSYVVGPAWQGDDAWFYPQERLSGSMTGLAVVLACDPSHRAADGERCDASLPQAAVQSLQLPIVLGVTNLANGNQILVRADDRGPPSPGRLIALNAKANSLLGIGTGEPARVRLDIDPDLSAAVEGDLAGAPHADIQAAPQQAVEEQPLDAPGPKPASSVVTMAAPAAARPADIDAILRSQSVRRTPVEETSLWIDLGVYSTPSVARSIADEAGGTVSSEGEGHHAALAVQSGPFDSTAQADAALKRARDSGITGARIVVR